MSVLEMQAHYKVKSVGLGIGIKMIN